MLRKGWANISDFSQEKFRLCRKEIFEDDTRRCLHKVHGIIVRIISTKMLVKHSHFRDVLSVLRLILCFRVLREQLGSISCTIKFARAFWANFRCAVPYYHGLSFFFLVHFSSFFCEKRKKNERIKNKFLNLRKISVLI